MQQPKVQLVCCLAFWALFAQSQAGPAVGPFDVEIEGVADCDVKGNGDITLENLQVKATSKNTIEMSVDATNKIPYDDEIEITAELKSFDVEKGAYGPKSLKVPIGKGCGVLKSYIPKSAEKLMKAIGVEKCPIPASTYSLKKFEMEMTIPLSTAPYKKFSVDIDFRKAGALVLCQRVFFRTAPEGTVKY